MATENMSFLNTNTRDTTKRKMWISESQKIKLRNFCESTSLHGFSFLYHSKSVAIRLVWIFAIVAMMGVGTFFLVDNTDTYLKSRLVTNIESSTDDLDVSIYIINTYKSRKIGKDT